MKNLMTAIMAKTVGSALSSRVGGRIFRGTAPPKTEYPYLVFFAVGGSPEPTFSEDIRKRQIQFSFYSESQDITEIAGMEADTETLFHEQDLTVTGAKQAWAKKISEPVDMTEAITTEPGAATVNHWVVDYEFSTSLT